MSDPFSKVLQSFISSQNAARQQQVDLMRMDQNTRRLDLMESQGLANIEQDRRRNELTAQQIALGEDKLAEQRTVNQDQKKYRDALIQNNASTLALQQNEFAQNTRDNNRIKTQEDTRMLLERLRDLTGTTDYNAQADILRNDPEKLDSFVSELVQMDVAAKGRGASGMFGAGKYFEGIQIMDGQMIPMLSVEGQDGLVPLTDMAGSGMDEKIITGSPKALRGFLRNINPLYFSAGAGLGLSTSDEQTTLGTLSDNMVNQQNATEIDYSSILANGFINAATDGAAVLRSGEDQNNNLVDADKIAIKNNYDVNVDSLLQNLNNDDVKDHINEKTSLLEEVKDMTVTEFESLDSGTQQRYLDAVNQGIGWSRKIAGAKAGFVDLPVEFAGNLLKDTGKLLTGFVPEAQRIRWGWQDVDESSKEYWTPKAINSDGDIKSEAKQSFDQFRLENPYLTMDSLKAKLKEKNGDTIGRKINDPDRIQALKDSENTPADDRIKGSAVVYANGIPTLVTAEELNNLVRVDNNLGITKVTKESLDQVRGIVSQSVNPETTAPQQNTINSIFDALVAKVGMDLAITGEDSFKRTKLTGKQLELITNFTRPEFFTRGTGIVRAEPRISKEAYARLLSGDSLDGNLSAVRKAHYDGINSMLSGLMTAETARTAKIIANKKAQISAANKAIESGKERYNNLKTHVEDMAIGTWGSGDGKEFGDKWGANFLENWHRGSSLAIAQYGSGINTPWSTAFQSFLKYASSEKDGGFGAGVQMAGMSADLERARTNLNKRMFSPDLSAQTSLAPALAAQLLGYYNNVSSAEKFLTEIMEPVLRKSGGTFSPSSRDGLLAAAAQTRNVLSSRFKRDLVVTNDDKLRLFNHFYNSYVDDPANRSGR